MDAFSRETLGTSVFINLQQSLFRLNGHFGVSTFYNTTVFQPIAPNVCLFQLFHPYEALRSNLHLVSLNIDISSFNLIKPQ